MKKTSFIILALTMVIMLAVFTACASNTAKTKSAKSGLQSQQSAEKENSNTNGSTDNSSKSAQSDTESEANQPSDNSSNNTATNTKNILVVYFSATGTTKGVAEKVAATLDAHIFEIVPVKPYTDADLNYHDSSSRSTKEQNNSSVRPEISGTVENWDQYNTILIGYPIWWGDTPRIINTFADNYNFTGKTVATFCTSGGSGISRSENTLKNQISGATFLEGKKFNAGASEKDVLDWASSIGIRMKSDKTVKEL